VEGGKYGWEWYDDPSRSYPVATLFPRVTNLLGHNDNHQGEIRQKVSPDLLPHEARPVVLWDQADVVDVALLLVMSGDQHE
jgi:hypothetical protein